MKTTMSHYYSNTRVTNKKKQQHKKCWEDGEQSEPSNISGCGSRGTNHINYKFLLTLNIWLLMIQQFHSLGIYLREMKTYVHTMSCIWMLVATLSTIASNEMKICMNSGIGQINSGVFTRWDRVREVGLKYWCTEQWGWTSQTWCRWRNNTQENKCRGFLWHKILELSEIGYGDRNQKSGSFGVGMTVRDTK